MSRHPACILLGPLGVTGRSGLRVSALDIETDKNTCVHTCLLLLLVLLPLLVLLASMKIVQVQPSTAIA